MAKSKDWDSAENEVKSNWIKFNVPMEDKFKGVFLNRRAMKSTQAGKEGQMVNVYSFKGLEGSYHILDDKKKLVPEAIVVEEGSFYSVGGTATIDRQMQNIKVGQIIGLKFIEEKASKTKGFNPAKIVKVYTPKNEDGSYVFDDTVLNEQRVENYDNE